MMPVLIQLSGLDRPGLPPLDAPKAALLTSLLDPLSPPFDLTSVAWVVHNLHLSVTELARHPGVKANEKLRAITSSTAAAVEWLPRSSERPDVVMTEALSLWTCLLALDPQNADPKILKAVGALYFLVKSGNSHPSSVSLQALCQACLSTRSDSGEVRAAHTTAALIACSSLLVKATTQLQTRALARSSAAADMVEARIEKQMNGAHRFDLKSKIDDQTAVRGLTPLDVASTARLVKEGAERGSGRLLVAAIAHWFGVMPADMLPMRVFAATPGLIRIDASSSYAVVNLSGVLTELARVPLQGVLATGDVVYFPIPVWLTRLLQPLRQAAPGAESLLELPGLAFSATELRRLLCELELPRRITCGKFVADRALVLIEHLHDPIRIALATLDFSRIHKVSAAYERLSQAELLESVALRAQLDEWGELSIAPVGPRGYLSKVTPNLASVVAIGEALLKEVEALSPGPNSGVERLLRHHDAFIRFTAFMLACALLLRGQETTLVPAAALRLLVLPGFNDKGLPGTRAEVPELLFGPTLQYQLRYLKAHYIALALRLEQRATAATPWVAEVVAGLRRIAAGAHDLPLLAIIRFGQLAAYSHLDLVRDLGDAWVGKADAIRHAASDLLRSAGFSYSSRAAARRHVGGARPITAPTSAWSQNAWHDEGSRMQEAIFAAVRLKPQGGLIKSLPRRPA